METQLLQRRTTGPAGGTDSPEARASGASITQQLASLHQLADTIDQVIDTVASVNTETFSTHFRQSGGQ